MAPKSRHILSPDPGPAPVNEKAAYAAAIETPEHIQAQLETAGIEFTDDEGIPGLRLHPREGESKARAASPRRATLT